MLIAGMVFLWSFTKSAPNPTENRLVGPAPKTPTKANHGNVSPLPPVRPKTSPKAVKTPGASGQMTFASATSLTDPWERKNALETLGHDLTTSDPAEALAILERLTEPKDRKAFIAGMMGAAAKLPPDQAVALAATVPEGVDRNAALLSLATAWGVDPEDPGMQRILQMGSRELALGTVLALVDPVRGIAWANGLTSGDEQLSLMSRAVEGMARTDLDKARNYANSFQDPEERMFALSSISRIWARTEPQAAYEWADRIPDVHAREAAQHNAVVEWARQDLSAATQTALSLSPKIGGGALVAISNGVLQRFGPEEANTWASQLPTGTARDQVISNLSRQPDGMRLTHADGSITILPPKSPAQN